MKIAGKRKERDITFHAVCALLKEGALFNAEMQNAVHLSFFARRISLQIP